MGPPTKELEKRQPRCRIVYSALTAVNDPQRTIAMKRTTPPGLACTARMLPLLALSAAQFAAAAEAPPAHQVENRVEALLTRMTLQEKVGQLQQLDSVPEVWRVRDEHRGLIPRGLVGSFFNVRGARFINEAQRLAVEQSRLKIPLLFGFDVIHGYRTILPIPLGEASSWDPEAAERGARIAAAEAAATGLKWTFAPMVDIARDPRWGRISEGSGEDPYLGAAMARARVRGFQGNDPSAPDRILACAKHWVAYGAAEGGRDYNTVDLSEQTLRTIYFPPFRAALDAGVGYFMCSFNSINGVPASANPFTLTQVLRKEWHFDGLMVSDYESVEELLNHGVAADGADAARRHSWQGSIWKWSADCSPITWRRRWSRGRCPGRCSMRPCRVLRTKFRLGLFEHPYADESLEAKVVGTREHRAAAREIAARSMVLLKNDQGILPIKPQIRSIAVLGPLAADRDAPLSHWRGDGRVEDVVTLLAGLEASAARQSG